MISFGRRFYPQFASYIKQTVAITQSYELGRMWNENEEMKISVIRRGGKCNFLELQYSQ